jgi:hypothetical protein
MLVALVSYSRISVGWDVVCMAVSCCLFIMNTKILHYDDSPGKPPVANDQKCLLFRLAGMPMLLFYAAAK